MVLCVPNDRRTARKRKVKHDSLNLKSNFRKISNLNNFLRHLFRKIECTSKVVTPESENLNLVVGYH